MKSSTIVLHPLGGSRADFQIPATASVSSGEIVSLRKVDEDGRHGMIALVTSARFADPDRTVGTMDVIATYEDDVVGETPAHLEYGRYWCQHAAPELLAQYYGRVPMIDTSDGAREPILRVGTLLQEESVPVSFSATGFERHTAMFAQSGSGKSYSLGVLLEELVVNTTARIIVIDPNGDFTSIHLFKDDCKWTTLEQADHTREMQRIMQFTPSAIAEAEARMDELLANSYRGCVFNLNGVDVLLWQKVVSVILKRLWRARDKRVPTVIVVDESHHFAPADGPPEEDSPLKELGRMAAEGRKYGLWLVLATQRPQKLDGNVISQCDNLIVMKLTSRADTDYISQAYNGVTREMVELAYGFRKGEALTVGKLVKSPTMLRFRLRNTREGGADLSHDWAIPPRQRA